MLKHPAEEQIRPRALEFIKARDGGPSGTGTDWLQAERELLAEQERGSGLGERVGSAGRGTIILCDGDDLFVR